MTTLSHSMQEVNSLIGARIPIIWVLTHEEDRFINELIFEIIKPNKAQAWSWSICTGIVGIHDHNKAFTNTAPSKTASVQGALSHIATTTSSSNSGLQIYIMKDLGFYLQTPDARRLRDMYRQLTNEGKIIIVVSPLLVHGPSGQNEGLHPTLEKQVAVVEYTLPTYDELDQRIRKILNDIKLDNEATNFKVNYTEKEHEEIARAIKGLTLIEADNALALCLSKKQELDAELLLNAKRSIVRKSQILEFIDTEENIDDVGGLDEVKKFLNTYIKSYTSEARKYGVEPLKFLILLGLPGVGKSLTSKVIGHLYKIPLLRFDVGKVFGKMLGSSEARMREAISLAENLAPCGLFLDEMEKALSGNSNSSQTDGGTTSRVFGTFLTALQDGLQDVLVVATCNNISKMPPELLRRADEIFFVDLPSPEERIEILTIHLRKRGRDISMFKKRLDDFVNASHTYTGAEIEKSVKVAIAKAFDSGAQDVTPEHIISALKETKPIAQVMSDEIKALQDWAKEHARYASSYHNRKQEEKKETTTGRFRKLN